MNSERIRILKIIAEKIKQCGGETYFVGGFVRDKIMGIKSEDIDVEVHKITPDTLREILQNTTPHSEIGKSFGIFMLNDYNIDIALPRKDVQKGKGHRAFDVYIDPYIGTINAAKRRDFTVNSIMKNVLTGEIIDHFEGRRDIEKRIIRHVDNETFADDPLRILRAAQFAARFNFKICSETIMLSKNIQLTSLSKERVYEETKKALLKAAKPSLYFENLKVMEQLDFWFPKLILSEKEWEQTMANIDTGATFQKEADNPLAFMLLCVCLLLKNEDDVCTFLSAITSERRIKKYVTNLYSQTDKLYKAALHKESIYETNKIFDNAVDKKGLACAVSVLSGRNCEVVNFVNERMVSYNKILGEGFLQGKDLISIGLEQGRFFAHTLDRARDMRLKGYSKEQILDAIKTQNSL